MKLSAANRAKLLCACIFVILGGAVALSLNAMFKGRTAAIEASDDLVLCRELERVVAAMRQHSTIASAQAMEGQELARHIDAAARQAQMNPAALDGVFPQPNRRAGSSPYVEKPTLLILRNVELRPLAEFLYHLTNESKLNIRQLHLRTPHGDSSNDAWDVDATITSLIYSPDANARGE